MIVPPFLPRWAKHTTGDSYSWCAGHKFGFGQTFSVEIWSCYRKMVWVVLHHSCPIGSMYGTSISTYIWLVFMVNVGQVNIPCMDPMGYGLRITGPLIASDKCRYLCRAAGTLASWQLGFQWWNSAIENSRKQETIVTSLHSGWFGSVVMISFHVPTSCTIGSVTFTNEPLRFLLSQPTKKEVYVST